MLNIPLVAADWIIVFFIKSIDAPLPTCVFSLTSYCSCYSYCCCFVLSSTLLFLLPVRVVPSDEAVLRHRDTSRTCKILQWPFAVHTVAEIAHWLNYPATSFIKIKKRKEERGCTRKAKPCAPEPQYVRLYQRL